MADVWTAPACKGRVVVPSDTTIVGCRAIYVGGAGDINGELLDDNDGQTTLFVGLLAGMVYPLSFKRIYSASTTATLIVALT